ncbi:MAG: c-type cytochrome [Actinomycetota bacterium]
MVLALSTTFRTTAWVLAVVLLIGFAVYYWFNIRSARDEIGAELELPPNIVAPPPDEVLEGRRLEGVQFWGVIFLLIIGIGLPFYWLREPGRQSGAVESFDSVAVSRGENLYVEGFQCSNCHGVDGGGGVAGFILPVPLTDENGDLVVDDEGNQQVFNVNVSWTSPKLTDVLLRYSEDEVREILNWGRAGSPMAAWGVPGGGVGTEQEIDNVIAYLREIQLDPDESIESNADLTDGAELFAQHCARCHTQGWQWAQNSSTEDLVEAAMNVDAVAPGTQLPIGSMGGGAFGPRLAQENLAEQFLTVEDMVDFITVGADDNVGYGTRGIGNGQMPGYGQLLTQEQITAIVEYERGLTHEDEDANPVAPACEEFLDFDDERLGNLADSNYPVDAALEFCGGVVEEAG